MRAMIGGHGLDHWVDGEVGPPVVLIMGFGARGRAWRHQVPALAAAHRVLWYDHRGIGESEATRSPLSAAVLAGEAVGLMDHLGWDTAHVVGVSLGGFVAQELALAWPGRVRSLSLVATHPGGLSSVIPTLAGLRGFLAANLTPPARRYEAIAELLFPPEFLARVDRAELLAGLRLDFGPGSTAKARLAQFPAALEPDRSPRLARLPRIPALIVRPGKDLLVRPEGSDRLQRALPHARLLALPEAGHGVLYQNAREVNEALLDLYREADRRP